MTATMLCVWLLIFPVITQVFPDEYHLHTLDQFLSATARLNPHVDVKAIVIGMMDRLSSYAARESDSNLPEERKKAEEDATARLFERLKISKDFKDPKNPENTGESKNAQQNGASANGEQSATSDNIPQDAATAGESADTSSRTNGDNDKARGIPDNVRLFEVFYEQVMNLVNMQRLPIQDITALLTSLINLAL